MKSLWLKDRPWILTFAIVGAIGLAVAASQVGFMRLFVVGPNRLEILFYGAGSAALLLGAVAVLWDDILGTREFLMQRPISREALIRSRMLACFAVLASWMITVPLASWLHAAFWSDIYDLRFWAGLPEILSTLQIVWPMCAIGFLAASVPSPWWMRLVLAALLTATVGVAIRQVGCRGIGRRVCLGVLDTCSGVVSVSNWLQRSACGSRSTVVASHAMDGWGGLRGFARLHRWWFGARGPEALH